MRERGKFDALFSADIHGPHDLYKGQRGLDLGQITPYGLHLAVPRMAPGALFLRLTSRANVTTSVGVWAGLYLRSPPEFDSRTSGLV